MDEDRYYNLGSHDKLFNQIDELTDALASRDAEIESLRQQLSASQKREVTLRKLIGEIYCSDDSSAEFTRKIEDVLSAMGNSYSKESTQGFEDWHSSHAKYMEPADIIHWCRDAYNAGVIAVQTELNAERNRRFEGNRISSQEYNDCQKRDVMLRDALEYHQAQTRPIQRTEEALAATADLDGLILCEKKPFEFRWKLRSNGFVQHTEKLLHTSSKHLWDITPLYRAWDPK